MTTSGEVDLKALLANVQPILHAEPYVFCSIPRDRYEALSFVPLGTFHEQEGITMIATQAQAADHGSPGAPAWACITLSVHSSLHAVGFLAAVSGQLAKAGISVNAVSAFFHDHLFVPWERRWQAMAVLENGSRS